MLCLNGGDDNLMTWKFKIVEIFDQSKVGIPPVGFSTFQAVIQLRLTPNMFTGKFKGAHKKRGGKFGLSHTFGICSISSNRSSMLADPTCLTCHLGATCTWVTGLPSKVLSYVCQIGLCCVLNFCAAQRYPDVCVLVHE